MSVFRLINDISCAIIKGKAIPLQASTGRQGSRRLGFTYFETTGSLMW